jgi:hypothetical protein
MPNAVLQRLVDERERETTAVDDILSAVADDERDPTESELQLIARKRDRCAELEAMIDPLLREEERRAASADASKFLRPVRAIAAGDPAPVQATASRPTGDAVYRTFAQFAFDSMIVQFPKMAARHGPDVRQRAAERLEAAAANTLLVDIPGILPPQHLQQIFDVINAQRPVVQSGRQITLSAVTATYPKITSRPDVGIQPAEKQEMASRKMSVAMATLTSDTHGGIGDLSWQDIQFSSPAALELWFQLAAEAYAQSTEQVACSEITANAGAGPTLPTVVPPATNTAADYLNAIAEAAGNVAELTRTYADVVYASPNVGFALAGMFGTGARTFGPNGEVDLSSGTGNVGGLRLVTSQQFAAGTLVVGNSQMLLCGETPAAPERLQAVEVSIGGVEVGIIGQFGATLIDANGFSKILGAPVAMRTEGGSGDGRRRKSESQ